jgi:hypothetical protein
MKGLDNLAAGAQSRADMQPAFELGRQGILRFLSLKKFDRLLLLMSTGAYLTAPDRKLQLGVELPEPNGIGARVLSDTYNELPAGDNRARWALPNGAGINLLGAYNHAIDHTDYSELQRDRGLLYLRVDVNREIFTNPISEIVLVTNGLQLHVFSQDLSVPALPPPQNL